MQIELWHSRFPQVYAKSTEDLHSLPQEQASLELLPTSGDHLSDLFRTQHCLTQTIITSPKGPTVLRLEYHLIGAQQRGGA